MAEVENYTYVVVGGGIAGVTCAEHLYILHPEERTLVITASALIKAVTNVLPLTKTLDAFDVEERNAEYLENQCPNVTALLSRCCGKARCKRTVCLRIFRQKIQIKKLCICTGAIPKVIAEDSPYVMWIRDTESVCQFQARMKGARRILIVGNGGIATEMVYEVTGIEIVWAIKDKHMTANFIDPGAAEFLRSELSKEKSDVTGPSKRRKYTVDEKERVSAVMGGALGPDWHSGLELRGSNQRSVTLETEVEVKEILEPDKFRQSGKELTRLIDWPVYVELTNGKVYGCDFIVSATGVTPNVEKLLAGNNLSVGEDGGLVINEQETKMYMLRGTHAWLGKGTALVSGEEIYMDFCFELFAHATRFFGYKVIILGLFNGQGLEGKYEILLRYTKGMEYIKCVMVDGRMQGAVLLGETDLEETFENLILNQMDLSPYGEDLLNPDVDIEDYFD
ncbi:Pyridine nucleotide-disulfide oxidoreductase domain-containing protein 1 [Penaeus vannamei]|uniref:Pyridine nucleotide-disulfide oxidoreductase domain-containing protein 1 n=1 Tax=Penaeus vannamei TaxID=6689 RepID=A0A423T2L4_PENVA|nr:Pyridine nucleotide-disulfide oxidoreductase domain-containing protein 1 [Penaeus vannamei]